MSSVKKFTIIFFVLCFAISSLAQNILPLLRNELEVRNRFAQVVEHVGDYYMSAGRAEATALTDIADFISDDHFEFAAFMFENGTIRTNPLMGGAPRFYCTKQNFLNLNFPTFQNAFEFFRDEVLLTYAQVLPTLPITAVTRAHHSVFLRFDSAFFSALGFPTPPPVQQHGRLDLEWVLDNDGVWRIFRYKSFLWREYLWTHTITSSSTFPDTDVVLTIPCST